jgi:hypothetical protein
MPPYVLTLLLFLLALTAQVFALWFAFRLTLRQRWHWSWLSVLLGLGMLLFDRWSTLRWTVQSGIFDEAQGMLSLWIGLLFAVGLYGVWRQVRQQTASPATANPPTPPAA